MAMTLAAARQLALAVLESKAAGCHFSDYDDAIKVLQADFKSRPTTPGYTGEHCRHCGENIRVGKVHTLLPSGGCREDRVPQAQDSSTDQLRRLVSIANNAGLYDAADHITLHLEIVEKRAQRREKWRLRETAGIPVEDHTDPEDRRGERCCFYRVFTNHWTALPDRTPGGQVACCRDCAKTRKPIEVPTKHDWCARERDITDGVIRGD
jgi:hypothetical protein